MASLPLVSSACGMVSAAYACTKESHPYVQSVCDAAEKGVKTLAVAAVSGAQPILTKLEPQSEWGWGWDGGAPPEPWGARKPALAEPSRGSGVGMVGFWRLEFILPTNTRGKGWRSWVGAAPHEFWGAGKLALAERLHSSGVGRSWFLISSFHH